MATKKGMDISTFQGNISWDKVTGIDFVIIRAGYGSNNIDNKAVQNIKGCISRKIPFGLYWFYNLLLYHTCWRNSLKAACRLCFRRF